MRVRANQWLRFVIVAAIGATAAASNGCSLIYSDSAAQCETTDECRARGAEFAQAVCSDRKVCEIDANVSCTTNKQCVDAFKGEPYICRKDNSQCTLLTSPDCPRLLADAPADVINDDTAWVGLFVDLTGETKSIGIPLMNAVNMARVDFKQAINGLPPVTAGGATRPLGFIVCDQERDPNNDAYVAAAKHLMGDGPGELNLAMVLGGQYSGRTIKMFNEVARPKKKLMIATVATSPAITTLADDNLLWRVPSSDAFVMEGFRLGLEQSLEPQLRLPTAQGGLGVLGASDNMKVMIVYKGDAFGQGLASLAANSLKYNGKAATAQSENFQQSDYGDFADSASPEAQAAFATTVQAINSFKPHLIILVGTGEVFNGIMQPTEATWSGVSYRPRWWTTGIPNSPDLLALINSPPSPVTPTDMRQRVGLFFNGPNDANNPLFGKFKIRYNAARAQHPIQTADQPDGYTALGYDIGYVAALNLIANGSKPITGENLKDTFSLLVPGPGRQKVELDLPNINGMVSALQVGQGVDIQGASGPLDFDLATGDVPQDVQLICPTFDPGTQQANGFQNSGTYYDAASKSTQGKFVCP